MKNVMLAAAAALLDAATPAARANVFGSIGELEHAVMMAEKWGGDWNRALVQALVRCAGQRGVPAAAEVFVWDEAALTHRIDHAALQRTCDALVAS